MVGKSPGFQNAFSIRGRSENLNLGEIAVNCSLQLLAFETTKPSLRRVLFTNAGGGGYSEPLRITAASEES